MRPRVFAFSVAALAALTPLSAHADPYRWCADYSGYDGGGGSNCGFVTLEQCKATIMGMGGYCVPNQFYTGPDQRQTAQPRKKARRPAAAG